MSGIKGFLNRSRNAPGRWTKALLAASAAAFVLSLFMQDRLTPPGRVLPELLAEPIQARGDLPEPFEAERKGVTYVITPLYSYELAGLVVSTHDADSFVDISHEAWRDYINIKDLCVIWGRNVETGVYAGMRFRNRDFTCFYTYPDEETGALFSEDCLSNNHLLPADEIVAAAVKRARKGDQVRFKGWLVSYGIKGSPYKRVSSATRKDRGNGACETVFVNEFRILREANPGWRTLRRVALWVFVLAAAAAVGLGSGRRPS
jgi:hypothetical protein